MAWVPGAEQLQGRKIPAVGFLSLRLGVNGTLNVDGRRGNRQEDLETTPLQPCLARRHRLFALLPYFLDILFCVRCTFRGADNGI